MFEQTKLKLEDTNIIFKMLININNAIEFRTLFNSFLTSSRAITNAMQKEGKHISGFNIWYNLKREEMRNDELLKFIHKARTEDFHEGMHRLTFPSAKFKKFSTENLNPPAPNASIGIGLEGPYWVINKGTPHQQRIPITQGGGYSIKISIKNAPTKHGNKTISKNDPITICNLALNYYKELVFEAINKFSSSQSSMKGN